MAKTKTCGDCIHADICEHLPNLPLFHRNNEAHCVTFKDRENLVEVVRCKDCKHYLKPQGFCKHDRHEYQTMAVPQEENDFCSYGERREGE